MKQLDYPGYCKEGSRYKVRYYSMKVQKNGKVRDQWGRPKWVGGIIRRIGSGSNKLKDIRASS